MESRFCRERYEYSLAGSDIKINNGDSKDVPNYLVRIEYRDSNGKSSFPLALALASLARSLASLDALAASQSFQGAEKAYRGEA